jgi:hypothetical protein
MKSLKINHKRLQAALDELMIAFDWRSSPQGAHEWITVAINLKDFGAIDKKSYPSAHSNPEDIIRSCSSFMDHLRASFIWSRSKQGKQYWDSISKEIDVILDMHKNNTPKMIDSFKAYDRAMKGI